MSEPVRVLEADLGLLNAQVEELSHAMNSSSSEVDQFREKFVDMANAARQVHSDNERMKTRLIELENELITLRDANQQLK
jgi:chromosome segregation ATPase